MDNHRTDNSLATRLRCEHKHNPIGIDAPRPRLSWQMRAPRMGARQTAYQVRVAPSAADLMHGDTPVWDSGKVAGDALVCEYAGPPLRSRQRYAWAVRLWDENGAASAWAAPAYWEMGLLAATDWTAKLIEPDLVEKADGPRPCPLLRKEFRLKGSVASARLYVTARGLYEARINGQRVGDEYFAPGWTTYDKCLQYQAHDVTDLLQAGDNALGVVLGDGWYRGNVSFLYLNNVYGSRVALLAQLEVTYDDGSTQVVTSDATWRCATGPIRASDIFDGETYDARLERPGWDAPGYDDRQWRRVFETPFDPRSLAAPKAPPVRKIEAVRPIAILHTPAGETVFDMGQNMVGWVRLRTAGVRGAAVTLQFGEILDQQGNFYNKNLRLAKATDTFILEGRGETETFEPHFTFHGFRYVKIVGLPDAATLDTISGVVLHSDLAVTGAFACSNDLVNRLFENILWTQRGNFLDVPTDCPQRDERMGWTADLQVFAATACLNMDTCAFLERWLRDLRLDQRADGLVPLTVPDPFTHRWDTFRRRVRAMVEGGAVNTQAIWDRYLALYHLNRSEGWADAGVIVPWTLYLYYGDRRILEEQYDSMRAMFEYRRRQAGRLTNLPRFRHALSRRDTWQHLRHYSSGWYGFGDWLAPGDGMEGSIRKSRMFIPAAYLAYDALLMSKTAATLGRDADAVAFRNTYEQARAAFRYVHQDADGRLSPHRQTTYVLALAFDLLPADERPRAARILADLVAGDDYRIGTGFLGTPYICQVLTDHGYVEHAYRLLLNESANWLLQVRHGATTIWEHWDAVREDGSFQSARMLSFNHYAPGAVGAWLYGVIAGIRPDERAPGFAHVVIAPVPGGGLTHAAAAYDSVRGRIASAWRIENDTLTLSVEIPANTTATIVIPEAYRGSVRLDEQEVQPVDGALEIGGGRYELRCR
ncbi:MAG: glycoside hydrolase family 78 protein [Anaerolineae bacterium]